MKGIKIKWGNVIIFLLIIAAGVAAFYYRDSQRRAGSIGDSARLGTTHRFVQMDQ